MAGAESTSWANARMGQVLAEAFGFHLSEVEIDGMVEAAFDVAATRRNPVNVTPVRAARRGDSASASEFADNIYISQEEDSQSANGVGQVQLDHSPISQVSTEDYPVILPGLGEESHPCWLPILRNMNLHRSNASTAFFSDINFFNLLALCNLFRFNFFLYFPTR